MSSQLPRILSIQNWVYDLNWKDLEKHYSIACESDIAV